MADFLLSRRRRLVAEINVVPYIDVMLVLLVIFMVTTPLMDQGIDIDLPNAMGQPVELEHKEPLVISINQLGQYYLNRDGAGKEKPLSLLELKRYIKVLTAKPDEFTVQVRADQEVVYKQVIDLISILQQLGIADVGLMTEHLTL